MAVGLRVTPAQWQKVKGLMEDALALGGAERTAFLAALPPEEADLRAEVESLLRAYAARPGFLETPCLIGADGDSDAADSSAEWIGRTLGSYRLIGLIGAGGMGAVFRATRADGLHERPVAVKLIRSGLGREYFLRRFNEERRILASLDHPNIARLLDGGATPEGVPYVVMEFVDGLPIDEFCERRMISTRERLQLFRTVCAAVQYAHQNLIVHRDLKPANILVNSDGQPKLLDFGISRICAPGQGSETERPLTLLPIMTPEFASPEQVRGTSITTVSDIYSLGVILYLLLTGRRPYGSASTPHELMQAVCETVPLRPSASVQRPASEPTDATHQRERQRLRRALRGDIDSIVLRAMRKDPQERYATVEQLSDDIRRHLGGLPVMARRGTAWYHLRKFLARHAIGVAAVAGITAVLIGAVIISVREAQVARLQEARAEARIKDVRKLADSLIFDIHDSIRNLPGASASRHLLVQTAVQYLDRLSREDTGDRALRLELAAAYQRLGEIQGGFTYSENDRAGAMNSYQHALALLEPTVAADPRDGRALTALTALYLRLSDISWLMGDGESVMRFSERALARSGALATLEPGNPQSQTLVIAVAADYGNKLYRLRGDVSGALARLVPAAARLETLWTRTPKNRQVSRSLCVLYYRTAEVWLHVHEYNQALAAAQNARRVVAAVLAESPHDADLQIQNSGALHYAAAALMGLNQLEEARRLEQEALAPVQALAAADTRVAEYQGFVGMGLDRLGEIAARERKVDRALELLRTGLQMSDHALESGTRHPYIRHENAQAAALLGSVYVQRASDARRSRARRAADWRSARDAYGRALESFRATIPIWFEATGEAEQAAAELQRCDQMLAKLR